MYLKKEKYLTLVPKYLPVSNLCGPAVSSTRACKPKQRPLSLQMIQSALEG